MPNHSGTAIPVANSSHGAALLEAGRMVLVISRGGWLCEDCVPLVLLVFHRCTMVVTQCGGNPCVSVRRPVLVLLHFALFYLHFRCFLGLGAPNSAPTPQNGLSTLGKKQCF